MNNRQQTIEKIKQTPEISVLIIGGGINGLGVFRDLALQGVDVLVVDRDDFCSGTSAGSSRMVHGGIRYLENGEFRLVREAVEERNRLIENAPHYVKPLPTTIPIFRHLSGLLNAPLKFLNVLDNPGERGALVIKMGLVMYDTFTAGQGTVPKHKVWSRREALRQFPKFNRKIVSAATYYDGTMRDAERIAIEVMLEGDAAHPGANALNYVSAVGAEQDEVLLQDQLSGEQFKVKPKLVINAAGPWIDFVNQALGETTRFIGGTKGSHIVLDHPELHDACNGNEIFFENDDGRIVLVYPLGGRVILGTSDLKIDNPDDARCTDEEVDYFLQLAKVVFPSIKIDRSQIVYSYTAVRPLPSSDANTTGQISRDHSNRVIEPGTFEFPIFNLIGGKWTTFRAFSEQVTDATLKRLGRARTLNTKKRAIGGGKDYPTGRTAQKQWVTAVAEETGVSEARVAQLFDRYGTGAKPLAAYISEGEDQPLKHCPDYSVREVIYVTEQEKVFHLTDFIQRRSLLALTGQVTYELLVELATIIGVTLGWSEDECEADVQRTVAIFDQYHNVEFGNQ
ncbi:MAG: glycerol-3-phosphate dehydrogenase/oxidase, partial [Chloroflexota bacterium]